jgi:hypothetical protein
MSGAHTRDKEVSGMTYRIFLPYDGLIKTWQRTILALATIASLSVIFAALAGACYVLVFLIHACSAVCQATLLAVNGNYVGVALTLIIGSIIGIGGKTMLVLSSASPSLRRGGVL